MRVWADREGVRVDMLAPELDGKGNDPDRPIMRAAIEGVQAGRYKGVVIGYSSRLARGARLTLELWDSVQAAGGRIVSARENIDGSTPDGRMHRTILAAIDERELEHHRERFEGLRRAATAAGVWQRRQTPRGYSKTQPRRGRLIPDEQADTVRWAFRARAAGASTATIADTLLMTTSGVRMLLANRVYLGELRVGGHVNPAAHPPLVTVTEFEAAQRPGARPPRSGETGPALLAGVVRCAGCGHLLTRGGSRKARVYGCAKRHSGERCPAPAAVTVAKLDAFVERAALAELARLSVTASEGDTVERAQAKLRAAEDELAAYLQATAALANVAAFAAGARRRNQAVETAHAELQAELGRRTAIPADGTGADVWETLDAHERNQLLRSLLQAVVVARAGGRGSRTPLGERVRILKFGARLQVPQRRGGVASGIVPIGLPDLDDPSVLRPPTREDEL